MSDPTRARRHHSYKGSREIVSLDGLVISDDDDGDRGWALKLFYILDFFIISWANNNNTETETQSPDRLNGIV